MLCLYANVLPNSLAEVNELVVHCALQSRRHRCVSVAPSTSVRVNCHCASLHCIGSAAGSQWCWLTWSINVAAMLCMPVA